MRGIRLVLFLFFSGADPEHLPQRSEPGKGRGYGDDRHGSHTDAPGGRQRRQKDAEQKGAADY
jgi:hypothetical protein